MKVEREAEGGEDVALDLCEFRAGWVSVNSFIDKISRVVSGARASGAAEISWWILCLEIMANHVEIEEK